MFRRSVRIVRVISPGHSVSLKMRIVKLGQFEETGTITRDIKIISQSINQSISQLISAELYLGRTATTAVNRMSSQ